MSGLQAISKLKENHYPLQILKISVLQSSKTSNGVCKIAFSISSCLLKIKPMIIKRIIP